MCYFVSVSSFTAYIIVTFRVQVSVRVRVKVRGTGSYSDNSYSKNASEKAQLTLTLTLTLTRTCYSPDRPVSNSGFCYSPDDGSFTLACTFSVHTPAQYL